MKYIKYILLIFMGIFAFSAFSLFQLNYWGVKYKDAQTNIFEKTKAYKHGTIRDIENLCLEIEKAESQSHKNAIKATIRHRISAFDYDGFPQHVKSCIDSL